jgi:hypothetical protein
MWRAKQMKTADQIQQILSRRMKQKFENVLFGGTSAGTSTTAAESTFDIAKTFPEWDKMLRNARRSQVTFVVDMAHPGPPIGHDTPNEGSRIEMSWQQANEVHKHWPLKLFKVLSTEAAEFIPVTPMMGEFVAAVLPMPPYDVPPEEAFEDWMAGKTG